MFNTSVMCFQVANIVHLATCMVVSPLLQYECSKSKHNYNGKCEWLYMIQCCYSGKAMQEWRSSEVNDHANKFIAK